SDDFANGAGVEGQVQTRAHADLEHAPTGQRHQALAISLNRTLPHRQLDELRHNRALVESHRMPLLWAAFIQLQAESAKRSHGSCSFRKKCLPGRNRSGVSKAPTWKCVSLGRALTSHVSVDPHLLQNPRVVPGDG